MTPVCRAAATAALLAWMAAGPAHAQQAPATTPPAPDASTPAPLPPLPQPDVSPSQLAAAREVIVSSGMARSFTPMVPQLREQIPLVVTRTRPEFAKELTAVLAGLDPEFDKKTDEMIDIAAKIYARSMTEDELKATAAFFDSPAGKKYVSAQPLMLDQLVVAMQSWTQETSNYMMKRVQVEMEKKGDKF